MVFVKRIDLRGFKTFGRKVTLRLGQGLTVITGPNGSGKSNILDALRFALGELSPKELRGASISDLISKSNVPNPPRSVYVSVQFDNIDRRLPIDSGSVTISREFYKGGEGIYRINGRRVSRKQLTELLSSADISVGGYNIVPQHAVTRLAEVTSEERRKIVEDLIGLGVYDLRKAEAQLQLNQADTNIKIASARVDEVRLRVESLERERNDFLRHSLLTKEISKLQAQTISRNIATHNEEMGTLKSQIGEAESKLSDLRGERDRLSASRLQLEQELRNLQERLMDEGGQRIHELERNLSEINSKIVAARADIESKRLNLQILGKQKGSSAEDADQHKLELESTISELRKLRDEGSQLDILLKEIEVSGLQLSEQLRGIEDATADKSNILERVEGALGSTAEELVKLRFQIETESAKITIAKEQSEALQSEESENQRTIEIMQKRKAELAELVANQEKRLSQIDREMIQYVTLKEKRQEELEKVVRTSEIATGSILEFDAQRKIIDLLAPKEVALAEIEALQSSGILNNIVGRLGDLIQFDKTYEKAVHAACTDWLDSLIVKDAATAIACIEYLKRSKLSPIKIIPLDIVATSPPQNETLNIEGVVSRMIDCIEYDASIDAAVNYVLGDTIVTSSQRAAYLSSLKGFRAVVLTGDLYESGGAMQGGYYRRPLDMGAMVPRTGTLSDLKKVVSSLIDLIEKSRSNLTALVSKADELRMEKILLQKNLERIQDDVKTVQERLRLTSESLAATGEKLRSATELIEKNSSNLQSLRLRETELEEALKRLEDERTALRNALRSDEPKNIEEQYSALKDELSRLRSNKAIIDSRASSLDAAVKSKSSLLERTKDQLRYLQEREQEVASSLALAEKDLEDWTSKLAELTSERESLFKSLESLREQTTESQARLDEQNKTLHSLEVEIEPLNSSMTQLRLELNKKELEENFLLEELNRLGFSKPVDISSLDSKTLETNLSTLREELQQIGAINELAVTHYEEQKNNYKQLSVRINKLEEEKRSILRFMEELEQKKRETFMAVFDKLDQNFNEIFSKITDGGRGSLVLENPGEIFTGGLDMHLAFPGKAELSIGSASGGEKSVATVCFLLALQGIHPMPFYVFDEIDAHLDMVNSQRLADLLKERSAGSQFIVVSLKDTTIARASSVYGIFIEEGFSQVVSLPKPEAQPIVGTG